MGTSKKKKKDSSKLHISNRQAHFHYTLLKEYNAGIVLQGSEVKSIRMGKVNLKDAFCFFQNNELWVKGIHISPYQPKSITPPLPTRTRKLLLHKKELRILQKTKEEKRLTIIPISLFLTQKELIKVKIALAKGKKNYDKRAAIKAKDLARDRAREEVSSSN